MLKFKKRYVAAILAAALSFTVSAGTTSAYLSRSPDSLTNVITAGSVSITLEENNWNPDNAKDIHPLQSVKKDPVVKNIGENDAWVFLEVSVPRRNLIIVDHSTKIKTAKQQNDLFSFVADNVNWDLVDESVDSDVHKYVYGYKTVLHPGSSTQALFNEIKTVNYLEGELGSNENFNVEVIAKAIQSNVDSDGTLNGIYSELIQQNEADAG